MWKIIIILFILVPSLAFSASWKESADKVIDRVLLESGVDKKHFGIWVSRGEKPSGVNSTKPFIPASLSKIPTALAFLNKFKMNDHFYTWVYKTGSIQDGTLKGDIYLKGGGDPTFVNESMWMLINKLKRDDIKKIEGQIYVDESYFDQDYYSEGRQKRRVDRAYDAPISALSFNWNSVSIYVRPGSRKGAKARVYLDPPVPFVSIINRAKTTGALKTNLKVTRKMRKGKLEIIVSGEISTATQEKGIFKSIEDPAYWAGLNFKYFLNQFGIFYTGSIQKKITPKNADLLVEHKSWAMGRVVSAMSKFSNNFVAEVLTKHLGKKGDRPATIDDGLNEIIGFLKTRGWKEENFKFFNPSGFTRKNKMRADDLGQLLQSSSEDFSYFPEFLSSLPISGIDGTLKKRMRQTMRGKVRAKTGYLTGAVGLAGYMQPQRGGKPMTFVFFYNGPYKHDWTVKAMFDKLLWRLYQKT